MIIYLITNTVNGKTYVGQHCGDTDSRWKQHLKSALKVENPLPLYRAMRKYGVDKFKYEVLEQVPLSKGQKFLDDRERFWIKEKKSFIGENGYNVTEGGQGVMTFYCSSVRSDKLSDSLDTKNYGQYDPFTGKLIKIWDKAKDAEKELGVRSSHMLNASNWHKGEGRYGKTAGGFMWLVLDNNENFPEYITPLSIKKTGNFGKSKLGQQIINKQSGQEISQYSLSGFLIDTFPNNTREVERITGIRASSIGNAIKGKTRVGSGYQWRLFPIGESPDKIDSEIVRSEIQFSKRELTSKPVIKILDNREVFAYKSVIDAVLDNNLKPMDVIVSLQNGTEDPKGFNWKWKS